MDRKEVDAAMLKPCPFCGYEFKDEDMDDVVYPVGRTDLWQVVCLEIAGGCGGGNIGGSVEEAIENWNKRTEMRGEPEVISYAPDYSTCTLTTDIEASLTYGDYLYYVRVYPDSPILKLLKELDGLTYSFNSRRAMEIIREKIFKEMGKE